MSNKPKLNKLMETILRKSKPIVDPVKEQDTLLHDGSKESDRILRSFIPFILNKKRQFQNNVRASYATQLGVFKDPTSVSKNKANFPMLKKAEDDQDDLLNPESFEVKEVKEGEDNSFPRTPKSRKKKPVTKKKKPAEKKKTTTTTRTAPKKQIKEIDGDQTSKKSEEEIEEEEQRKRDISNSIYSGMDIDDDIFDDVADLAEELHGAVGRMNDAKKPGSNPAPYIDKVEKVQYKFAEQVAKAMIPFVIGRHKDFIKGDLADVNLGKIMEDKYTSFGSVRLGTHSIGVFNNLVNKIAQKLSKNDKLKKFGDGLFLANEKDMENYDLEADFNKNFDMESLVQAVKESMFVGKDKKNYGDFNAGVLGSRLKTNLNAISKSPTSRLSINNLEVIRDVLGNVIGTIPDNFLRAMKEMFKNYEDMINDPELSKAKKAQLRKDYKKYLHIKDTMKMAIGDKSEGEADYRAHLVENTMPGVRDSLIGKTILNKDILDNIDSESLGNLRGEIDKAVKKPKSFLDGTFMEKYMDMLMLIRETKLDDEEDKFFNFLPYDTKDDDIEFYMKAFDSLIYFGREYYPGSLGHIFSSIDRLVHEMDREVEQDEERKNEDLSRRLKNYRDILNLTEHALKDRTRTPEEVYDLKNRLADKNIANSYDDEELTDKLAEYKLSQGGKLGNREVKDATDVDIEDMIEKINKVNKFFSYGDPTKKPIDGPSLLTRANNLREDPKDLKKFIKEFNDKTYDKAQENMDEVDRIARMTDMSREEVLNNLEKHKGYSPDKLVKLAPSRLTADATDILNAYRVQQETPDALKGRSVFTYNKKDLTDAQSDYKKEKQEAVKNVAKNFESIANYVGGLRVTEEEYEEWKKDPTKAEHFMRDYTSAHFELEKIRDILQEKPNDPLKLEFDQFMQSFLRNKQIYRKFAGKAGADLEKLSAEIVKYGDSYMSEDHREEIENTDKIQKDIRHLEEVQDMLNSKISQEMYENQGMLKENEFFKYVENEDGKSDLDLYRLIQGKDGKFKEEKVTKKEIKKREDAFLTAIPQLSQHYNLSKKQRNMMRKFANAAHSYSRSEKGTIGRGRYGRIVQDLKDSLSNFLPEEVISGLEGVSRMNFQEHKGNLLNNILKMTAQKPEVRFTNSFISDMFSGKVQGVNSENLLEIADKTSQEGTAHIVPNSVDGQDTVIVGGKLYLGNSKDLGQDVDLPGGVHADQIVYQKKNQKIRNVLSGKDLGNGMMSSGEIKAEHQPTDYSSLSNYGEAAPKFNFNKIPKAIGAGKGKTLEGLGSVVGRVFKEDDPSWLEVIE